MGTMIKEILEQSIEKCLKAWKGWLFCAVILGGLGIVAVLGFWGITPAPVRDLVNDMVSAPGGSFEMPHADVAKDSLTAEQAEAQKQWMEKYEPLMAWGKKIWPLLAFGALAYFLLYVWLQGGAMVYLAGFFKGQKPPLSEIWRGGIKVFFKLALCQLLLIAVVMAWGLVGALAIPLAGKLARILGILFGGAYLLVSAVLFIWLAVRVVLSPVSAALGGMMPVAAIRNSFRLTKGHWLPLFLCMLLIGVTGAVLRWLIQFIFGLGGVGALMAAGNLFSGLVGSLFSFVFLSFTVYLFGRLQERAR